MTREEAISEISEILFELGFEDTLSTDKRVEALNVAIKALEAWDNFKQLLDKRILEQGFDEDEWSISYNELIKMMKKCGGVE